MIALFSVGKLLLWLMAGTAAVIALALFILTRKVFRPCIMKDDHINTRPG